MPASPPRDTLSFSKASKAISSGLTIKKYAHLPNLGSTWASRSDPVEETATFIVTS
jgi:hypothetical protein